MMDRSYRVFSRSGEMTGCANVTKPNETVVTKGTERLADGRSTHPGQQREEETTKKVEKTKETTV
jgi:hypothetical protein